MSEIALEFDHVWKKFKKGEIYDSLRDLIPALTKGIFSHNGKNELEEREFWAVRDVFFQVKRGEAMGIIGPNGAGKSTILKLLSKILRPNRGQIRTHGRLSALIEVGAGFHPDLTGRENVFLNGAILGMSRQEIARKFDDIVAFSGIEDFIDTPVKRYSSGMYARLGFSVAAHVDPEILLVDEVLSVGDMKFQEKCLERMRSIVSQGTTVLFVSHNIHAVRMLCSRTLLLRSGQVARLGPTGEALREYLAAPSSSSASSGFPTLIDQIELRDCHGSKRTEFVPGEKAELRFSVRPNKPLGQCLLGFIIERATDRLKVCDYNIRLSDLGPSADTLTVPVSLAVDFCMNLLRGAYTISLHIFDSATATHLCRAHNVASFFVDETMSWEGVSHVNPTVRELEGGRPATGEQI